MGVVIFMILCFGAREINTISGASGGFSTKRPVDRIDGRMERMITVFQEVLASKSRVLVSELGYFEGMKTVSVKRVSLHVAFWLVYLTQDITLIYLWDKDKHIGVAVPHQLMFAALNSLSSLIPKLLFVYYVLYYNLPKLLNSKRDRKKYIAQLLLALLLTTTLYRVMAIYFQSPVIYKKTVNFGPFFSIEWFLQMLADIGFASGAAIVIKQFRLQLADKEREKNLIKDKLETELKFLRNQTNPHFLFNTLNNIYALARKRSNETADVVMKLSKLLRFMLYETGSAQIRISDEIKVLDDYIELEKLRYNDRLTISFIREIDDENEMIAPLLLIPLVENAFKHGASESRFDSFINLDMILQDGILEFSISNSKEQNGKRINDENIGLSNVRRQLELLYKDYEVSINCEDTTYMVFVKINLREYANL
jgi:two-component system LytT family sensor kinase